MPPTQRYLRSDNRDNHRRGVRRQPAGKSPAAKRPHPPGAGPGQPGPTLAAEDPGSLDRHRVVRRRDVCRLTGLARSTLYRMVQAGEFPLPVRLGQRAVAWRLEEVLRWLDSRPRAGVGDWSDANGPDHQAGPSEPDQDHVGE